MHLYQQKFEEREAYDEQLARHPAVAPVGRVPEREDLLDRGISAAMGGQAFHSLSVLLAIQLSLLLMAYTEALELLLP